MAELRTLQAQDDDDSDVEHIQFKVILLGDGAVGKTSLAMRFCENHFGKQYKQTIGLDFFVQNVELPGNVHATMQIWDIGGQSIGGKMISNYIFGSHAVLLVYDITNYQSFQDLEDWLRLVKRTFDAAGENSQMPYAALVGNKLDLGHLRAVRRETHDQFCDENDLNSFLCSAKSGDQVKAAFTRIAADLAGVTISKPELDIAQSAVKAEIIDHVQNDASYPAVDASEVAKQRGNKCCIQ
jgi:Ras-related protein Rab-28